MPDYTLLTPITQQVEDAAGASVDAFFIVGRDYIAPGMENLVEGLHLAIVHAWTTAANSAATRANFAARQAVLPSLRPENIAFRLSDERSIECRHHILPTQAFKCLTGL